MEGGGGPGVFTIAVDFPPHGPPVNTTRCTAPPARLTERRNMMVARHVDVDS